MQILQALIAKITTNACSKDRYIYIRCENLELFLLAMRREFIQGRRRELGELNTDPQEFILSLICSVKKRECCEELCEHCPG